MSKRSVTRQVNVCDSCGKEYDFGYCCINCNQDICFDCAKKSGQNYNSGVHHSGGEDGFYCNTCLSMPRDKWHPLARRLLDAHRAVAALRMMESAHYQSVKQKQDEAEQEVKDAYLRGGWLK